MRNFYLALDICINIYTWKNNYMKPIKICEKQKNEM